MLDLIARRYPSRRPSDMVDGLDSYQAMSLDFALAFKYETLEREREQSQLEVILASMDNLMRVQGAKVKKRKPHESLIRPYRDPSEQKATDDLPRVEDVVNALTGGVTVVNMEGLINNGE